MTALWRARRNFMAGYLPLELRPSTQIRCWNAALKRQQIERRRLAAGQDRTAGMRLAAMMGLMIEQMQQDVLQRLAIRLA
jgi:hypothetical protein